MPGIPIALSPSSITLLDLVSVSVCVCGCGWAGGLVDGFGCCLLVQNPISHEYLSLHKLMNVN